MENRAEFNVTVQLDLTVTQEDIDDIMCTALEGGITYWCCKAGVVGKKYLGTYASEQISRGGELKLYDAESDDTWVLTRDKFLNGIKLWAEFGSDPCTAIQGNGTLDCCQIDAEIADAIVQYAVFGSLIFG
ncbi:MAG: hypothetical protein RR365_08885 [Bacteroides sp.]